MSGKSFLSTQHTSQRPNTRQKSCLNLDDIRSGQITFVHKKPPATTPSHSRLHTYIPPIEVAKLIEQKYTFKASKTETLIVQIPPDRPLTLQMRRVLRRIERLHDLNDKEINDLKVLNKR